MTREQLTALLRELLTALSAAAVTWGVLSETHWAAISSAIVALLTLIWAVRANEGIEMLFTLARKLVSATAGAVMVFGVIDAARIEAMTSVALALLAFAWAFASKSGPAANPTPPKK